MKEQLTQLLTGQALSLEQSRAAFELIMTGAATASRSTLSRANGGAGNSSDDRIACPA